MTPEIESLVGAYVGVALDRCGFLARLVATTSSIAAAPLMLETSGLAVTLVSDRESPQGKVSSELQNIREREEARTRRLASDAPPQPAKPAFDPR